MKRVHIIAIALFGIGGISAGLGLSLGGPTPTEPVVTAAPAELAVEADPCAEIRAQGTPCEFVAFPEMEIRASSGSSLAALEP